VRSEFLTLIFLVQVLLLLRLSEHWNNLDLNPQSCELFQNLSASPGAFVANYLTNSASSRDKRTLHFAFVFRVSNANGTPESAK
jgi:hypothetical protein